MPLQNDLIRFTFYSVLFLTLFIVASDSFASAATPGIGSGLPWEGPLDKIGRSISGPVAFVVSLVGLVAAGGMLIWGGDINNFLRVLVYIVLVISIIVFASNLLTGVLFTGAVVPDVLPVSR